MNNLSDLKNIEKYLQGSMTEQEMEDMEVRMLLDDHFRNDFDTVKILLHGIKSSARQTTIKEKIVQLKTNKSVPEIRQGKIRWTLAVAVSVAAIFAFIFIPAITTNPTSEQLFTMNFEIAPNRLNQIARGSISKQISAPAYQAYDQGDYWQAAQLFEKTMDESAYRLTDLFYLGNCYLALGEWEKAINALKEVAYSPHSMAENAKWYLSLAYLRTGEIEKARDLLKEVAAPTDRAKKAKKIFRQLGL